MFPVRLGVAFVLAILGFPAVVHGQALALKPALTPDPVAEMCELVPAQSLVSLSSLAIVDSLLAQGSEAAILGDHDVAAELLRQAAMLDPGNPVIAYRLGRTLEDRGESDLAVKEYCRFLQIAPAGSDRAEVEGRIASLGSSSLEPVREQLAEAVRTGLEAYGQRRYQAAEAAFSQAVSLRPSWAAAYYNRGVARLALRQTAAAAADFERYLELAPTAEDGVLVRSQVESLRLASARRLPPPGVALAGGLVIPGLGQHVTRRPVAGFLVLGGVAGAIYWGLREELVTKTASAIDPFGNPYEYQVRALERTNLVPGIAVAAGIAVAGAIEAYLYASSRTPIGAVTASLPERRWQPYLGISDLGRRTHLGVRFRPGAR